MKTKNGWTLVGVNRKTQWVLLEGVCACGGKTGEAMPMADANAFCAGQTPICDDCLTPPDFVGAISTEVTHHEN